MPERLLLTGKISSCLFATGQIEFVETFDFFQVRYSQVWNFKYVLYK